MAQGGRSLKPERSQAGDAVRCRADEEEVLGEEVGAEYQVVAEWNWLDELVPGEDEVGEHEEDCSQCVEGAALEHAAQKHCGDDDCIYADSYADDSGRCLRNDLGEDYGKKADKAYSQHCEVAFCPGRQFLVMLDFCKVSLDEEPYIEYMSDSEGAHLSDEVVA